MSAPETVHLRLGLTEALHFAPGEGEGRCGLLPLAGWPAGGFWLLKLALLGPELGALLHHFSRGKDSREHLPSPSLLALDPGPSRSQAAWVMPGEAWAHCFGSHFSFLRGGAW